MTKSIGQYDKYRWKIKPFPTKQKLPVLLPQRAGRQGAVLLAFFHKFVAALRAGDLDVAFSSGHADLLLALRAAKMPVGAQIQQSGCLGREKAAHRLGHLQKLLVFFIALADIFRKNPKDGKDCQRKRQDVQRIPPGKSEHHIQNEHQQQGKKSQLVGAISSIHHPCKPIHVKFLLLIVNFCP